MGCNNITRAAFNGIENKLRRISDVIKNKETVVLDIGIDGVPLLCYLYLGTKKPSSVNNYLKDFASELSNLLKNGLNINGKILEIKMRAFICDSPAKAVLCQTLGEFARKPRCFEEIKRWKAVEFRQFILYMGIFVLKDSVDANVYNHFLLLHAAYIGSF
ncbi:uncharacterized protein [Eurosta solidaginis]|uniref:uncharacterized protein n=1 Tax=Eurosta solidaginis TaxID=178769 RepID=UPI00353170D1